MAYKNLTIYLAGAIRDNHPEDIAWRESVIDALKSVPVRILNPLGGKSYEDGRWTVSGVPSTAAFIFDHDKWAVREADAVAFNFDALKDGYPNIGTLVEFGMAVALGKLIYVAIDPNYLGHENARMYKLHPFLERPSAHVFPSVEEMTKFLTRHMKVLSGASPSFAQYRLEQSVAAQQQRAQDAGSGR